MKLDSVKNIKIFQKTLYAKQLECYSYLCELYSELAKLQGPEATAEEIENRYSKPLSLAVKGDLDFNKYGNYEPIEIEIFTKYAKISQELNEYKTSINMLSEVIVNE